MNTSLSLAADTGELPAQPKPIAYSYVRFSTSKQELGDSLRRQVQMAEEYCRKHGLQLAEKSYRDLGVSAFKRKNVEKGALAAFIDAVKAGIVPKGSFLVIEQFDRLSRADVNVALKLLLDLVQSGVTVVTLADEKVWDGETIKDFTNLIVAIVFMSRANNESAHKAKRISEAWGAKKRKAALTGALVTSEGPKWLELNKDKTAFVPIAAKVESIQRVFEMRIGGYGISSIVTRANQEQWPVPGKAPLQKSGEELEAFRLRAPSWHTSLVGRLLKNRALLGEYQPFRDAEDGKERIPEGEPIQGYYPRVIEETTFLKAQAKADRSGRFPGRRDASLKNWLQGLLRCTCGHSFVRKNKDSLAQPGYARYYCTARNRGVSNCPGASALELENAVLAVVTNVAPQFYSGTARIEQLKTNIDVLELDVTSAQHTRDRFVEAIGSTSTSIPALVARLKAADEQLQVASKALASARAELGDIAADDDEVFANVVRAVNAVDSLDARAALREDLSRIIEKVVVHQDEGFIRVTLRGSEVPVVQLLHSAGRLPTSEGLVIKYGDSDPE